MLGEISSEESNDKKSDKESDYEPSESSQGNGDDNGNSVNKGESAMVTRSRTRSSVIRLREEPKDLLILVSGVNKRRRDTPRRPAQRFKASIVDVGSSSSSSKAVDNNASVLEKVDNGTVTITSSESVALPVTPRLNLQDPIMVISSSSESESNNTRADSVFSPAMSSHQEHHPSASSYSTLDVRGFDLNLPYEEEKEEEDEERVGFNLPDLNLPAPDE